MAMVKGTLKKVKSGFQVVLPTKSGSTAFPIPENAQRFTVEAAKDGLEVDVERDAQNRIVKVTIPGQPEVVPRPSAPQGGRGPGGRPGARGAGPQRGFGGRPGQGPVYGGGGGQQTALRGQTKASPSVLGMAFHNPYTFLPFPSTPPKRHAPTPLTADELSPPDAEVRYTGIVELEVATLSPLLTSESRPQDAKAEHKVYRALTVGADVIVPATGVRGALRTLLAVITGGTLGYVNKHAFLCQGRDVNLGPAGPNSPPGTPGEVFLAEVVQRGSEFRSGRVRLGTTKLVRLDDIERHRRDLKRGPKGTKLWARLDAEGNLLAVSDRESPEHPWRLKLSGRPVNRKGKREGAFLACERTLELPPELWADYTGRNVHGDQSELRKGDLVWLEPSDANLREIRTAADIKSLQWARWGRRGQSLLKKLPPHVLPDYLDQENKLVDEVTDVFGQVSPERGVRTPAFAARVRPENLVFLDAQPKLQRQVTLAPLAPPHPGCIAFYRNNAQPDEVSETHGLRGYKVYRTTRERGPVPPWTYAAQGVYDDAGQLKTPSQQKVNKTCDLVPEGLTGQLRIAFRGLTRRELALLLQACAVPWRLGGGKPLGLGLCGVRLTRLLGEDGEPLGVQGWTLRSSEGAVEIDGWRDEIRDIQPRVAMWQASQQPVALMRYPRAVDENQNKKSRGGHTWFQRHAKPRMVTQRGEGSRVPGLEPLAIDGPLKDAAQAAGEPLDAVQPLIAGQPLPMFDASKPEADLLYGYDGYSPASEGEKRKRVHTRIEPFADHHVTGQEKSGGNQGKNAEFRKEQKRQRGEQSEDETS